MQFKFLLVLASIVTLTFGTDVGDLLDDLGNVRISMINLGGGISGFPVPGGTLAQALAIHNEAIAAKSAVDKTTTDAQVVTPTPLSESDGNAVLAAVNDIKPLIEDALTQIVTKKPGFDALPLGGVPALIKQDLTALNASTTALENTLIGASPPILLPLAKAAKAEIDAAFATALAAYSTP